MRRAGWLLVAAALFVASGGCETRDRSNPLDPYNNETGGLIEERDFQSWRLLNGPPTEYTRERFEDEYNWTVKWNMTVPGATYENTVDNRAWE